MANTVSNVFVKTYETTVRHLAQQGITRLLPHITVRNPGHSSSHNWERLTKVAATQKTTRLQATPVADAAWSRRQSVPTTWNVGDSSEQEDIVQMLVDPNSNLAHGQGMGMRRALDDIIIAAATGNALDGAGNNVAFPAGQLVGDGTAALSYDNITNVTQLFFANDIDPDEPKVFVIGPKQARKLLQLTEATNADYNAMRPLESKGYVQHWMGYTWVVSTRLLAPAGGQLSCLAMSKRALGLMMERDITSRVAEDPTVSFAWRIYSFLTAGAVRVEDEHIVHVKVLDSV